MRKKLIILINFILCSNVYNNIGAQNGINNISRFEDNNTIFTESAWLNDTLYVAGTVSKNDGRTATIIKYLETGELIGVHYLTDTFTNYGTGFWDKGLHIESNNLFHIASKSYKGTLHNGLMLQFNKGIEVLHETEFNSFLYPEDDFCRLRDFVKSTSAFYILDYTRKSETDFQCCLIKTDLEFNQIWRKCYGNSSLEIPYDLILKEDGNLLVIANSTNLDITDIYYGPGNGFYSGYLFEVDTNGVLNWEWRSSSKAESLYAGVLENDSILVVASGTGKEVCSDSQSNAICFYLWTGKAFKLNLKTGQKLWETSLSGGPHTSMFDNRYLDIIPSVEEDGYILCGAGYDTVPACRTDTIDKCWANPGVIAKISLSGDSLWLRKYFGVTDIYESNILYDAEITPDSGYSFVGEAFNSWPGETQGQHGWVLLTDKFGCLVPGCHLISSNHEFNDDTSNPDASMIIYPNPSFDNINVLISKQLPPNTILHLFNLNGQEIGSWRNVETGSTYIIGVENLFPGSYFLVLTTDISIIDSQKIIVH